MALHTADQYPDEVVHDTSAVRYTDSAGRTSLARVLGLAAAAVPTIVGLIAVSRVNWDTGLNAAAVAVADMSFGPWLAIGTLVAGLVGLLAASSWDSESKFAVGAIFACIGLAIILANPSIEEVTLSDQMGWMHLAVGAALVIAGALVGHRSATTRVFTRTRR